MQHNRAFHLQIEAARALYFPQRGRQRRNCRAIAMVPLSQSTIFHDAAPLLVDLRMHLVLPLLPPPGNGATVTVRDNSAARRMLIWAR